MLLSHTVLTVAAAVVIALSSGLALGASSAASLGSAAGDIFAESLVAQTQQLAPVVATIGVVVVLFGWVPAATATVSWAVLGFGFAMTTFGQLLNFPDWMDRLNLFGQLAEYPVEPVATTPIAVLIAVCIVGVVLGAWGFRRRAIQASVFSLGGQSTRVNW